METITGIHNCQNAENNWTQGAPPQLIHLQDNLYIEDSGRITGVGWKDCNSQRTKISIFLEIVSFTWLGSSTHEISILWSYKQDLQNDSASWQANMNGGNVTVPYPWIKNYRQLTTAEREPTSLLQGQPSIPGYLSQVLSPILMRIQATPIGLHN